MFYMLMASLEQRQALIEHLKSRDIVSVFHYIPLHSSEMGKKFGGKEGDCPVTEDVSLRLLRLPFYNSLSEDDLSRIVRSIHEFGFRNKPLKRKSDSVKNETLG
jgi:dTDP-4-amino-4,6-dideoxygalactose transaminase